MKRSLSFARQPGFLFAAVLLILARDPVCAAPASLDLGFGAGFVSTTFNGSGAGQAVAVQGDGKIVLAGSAENGATGESIFALVRYNADSSLDKTFNGTGKVTTRFPGDAQFTHFDEALAVVLQPDGKIVAVGRDSDGAALARYNPNGSLDPTFNGTGEVTTIVDFPGGATANAVALQPDGKIVIVGTYPAGGHFSGYFIARYNAGGSLDTGFGGSGIITASAVPGPYRLNAAGGVAVQANGKIVALANTSNDDTGTTTFTLVRYNSNGSLDTSFNGTGAALASGDYNQGSALRLQADGKIVVGGTTSDKTAEHLAVWRYNPNGTLDRTFNGSGEASTNFAAGDGVGAQDFSNSLTVQADGKIVLGGSTTDTQRHTFPGLVRFDPNGSLDTTFHGTGKVTTALASADFSPAGIALAGTRIVVAGQTYNATTSAFAALLYNADGSLDTNFHPIGKVSTPVGASDDFGHAIVVQKDGKILVAGTASNGSNRDFALVRYNADGTRDTAFDGNGEVLTDFNGVDAIGYGVALQADGKILVAGFTGNGFNDDFAVARYNPDGSLDKTFNSTGLVTTDFAGRTDDASAVAVQPDGKIVVVGTVQVGSSSYVFGVARYNSNGTLDTTFNGTGKVTSMVTPSGFSIANAVAIQPDGKIVVAGYAMGSSNYDFAVVRFNANGSLDPSFLVTGKETTAIGHSDDFGQSVALQNDGKIVVAGTSYTGSKYVSTLVRYDRNGDMDTTFNPTGRTATVSNAVGTGDYVGSKVTLQADGKIVLAGNAFNGSTPVVAVLRFTSSGVPDSTFNGTGQVLTSFWSGASAGAVALQADGKIVVGGAVSDGTNEDFAVLRYVGGQ